MAGRTVTSSTPHCPPASPIPVPKTKQGQSCLCKERCLQISKRPSLTPPSPGQPEALLPSAQGGVPGPYVQSWGRAQEPSLPTARFLCLLPHPSCPLRLALWPHLQDRMWAFSAPPTVQALEGRGAATAICEQGRGQQVGYRGDAGGMGHLVALLTVASGSQGQLP